MQRVRIRSLLNHIKSSHSQPIQCTPQPQATGQKGKTKECINDQNNMGSPNHNYFTIQPFESVPNKGSQLSDNKPEQGQKNISKNTIQVRKRGTKIANMAYMNINLNSKNKGEVVNLKELGIQVKKISDRTIRTTSRYVKVNSQFFDIFDVNLKDRHRDINSNKIKTCRSNTSSKRKTLFEGFTNFSTEKHLKRAKNSNQLTLINNSSYQAKRPEPLRSLNKVKGLSTLNFSNRKNSDITPWELESPKMFHL